mmetsp:Transcript_49137/g.123171  ORF Transcript_49137/g.123171 Transcript_49137/m.123171 type:complete len:86 (-) Transcript_49137:2055-2312(-)
MHLRVSALLTPCQATVLPGKTAAGWMDGWMGGGNTDRHTGMERDVGTHEGVKKGPRAFVPLTQTDMDGMGRADLSFPYRQANETT